MSNVKNQCHCHPIFFFSFLTTCCQVIYVSFLLVQVQFWDQYLSSRNDAEIGREHFFPLLALIPILEFVCMLSDTKHWSHISVIQNTYASLFLLSTTQPNFILHVLYRCAKLCPGWGYTVCKAWTNKYQNRTQISTPEAAWNLKLAYLYVEK